MKCPPAIAEVMLKILETGLLQIRVSAWQNGAATCAKQADHLHNIPSLLSDFTPEGKHHQVIHWAGLRWGKTIEEMPRPEVLRHFEDVYYRPIALGSLKRRVRRTRFRIHRDFGGPLKAKIKRMLRLNG